MIYEADHGVSDAELVERLDFHGLARRYGSWSAAAHRPPIVVGDPARFFPNVGDAVVRTALAAGVVHRSQELDRGIPLDSYRGEGIVAVGDELWSVQSTAAHENYNHDMVAGWVSGYRVRCVDRPRLRRLGRAALEAGDVQRAMVFAHFAGDALEPLDHIASSAALDDVLDKMLRVGLWSVEVIATDIDADDRHLAKVAVKTEQTVSADWSVPVQVRGDRVAFGAVPRAGLAQLEGLCLELPSPSGPLPPD